jgi:hypothetical protein
MGTLQLGISMSDLRPRLPQTETQGLEQTLTLPHTQVNTELPAQKGAQRFSVPEICCEPNIFRRFPKNLSDDLQMLLSQASWPPGTTTLLESSQPLALETSNPILHCAWGIPQHGGCLPAGHTLRDQQNPVKAVVIAGLIRPADLILQYQNRHRCVGDR